MRLMVLRLKFLLTLFLFFQFLPPSVAQDARERFLGLDKLLGADSFFDNHLTGFMLYDIDSQRVLYEKNSQLNFIPASTIKLFTFYASIMVLGDSSNVLRFIPRGKDVLIWGTGDPSWLYGPLPQPDLRSFFSAYDKIYFSDSNWNEDFVGFGWQWDDDAY